MVDHHGDFDGGVVCHDNYSISVAATGGAGGGMISDIALTFPIFSLILISDEVDTMTGKMRWAR